MSDVIGMRELEKRLGEIDGPNYALEVAIYDALDKLPGIMPPPNYTASLDAAVALCERVMPGCGLIVGKGRTRPDEPIWSAQIFASEMYRASEKPLGEAESNSTPAFALCLALVRAVTDKGEGK